ncbi:MAG: HAD family hydrolase [Candidatus Aenigmarchaeota archaeon]|nr:HAD family hydrolase [Candidatus Aenigmarchaeota archaeon]
MRPKAILFDLDGTILPFDGIIKHLQLTSKHFCVRVPTKKELLERAMGYSLKEIIPKIIPETKDIIDEFRKYYKRNYNADVKNIKPFSYARDVMVLVKRKKIKIGIVTTKRNHQSRVTLKYYKLPFDVLVGFDNVKKRKPDPEPIFKACKKLRVLPKDCIFVGDHPFDMQAAKAAGCFALGVTVGFGNKKTLKKAGADLVVKDLRSLKKLLQ